MKKVSTKLILLLLCASIVPMVIFGVLSILTSRKANYKTITSDHREIAFRAAEEIDLYVTNSIHIIQAIARNINKIHLKEWQIERIIKNYVLNFDEFDHIYLIDKNGMEGIKNNGSESGEMSHERAFNAASKGQIYRSDVFISGNLIPSMIVAVPLIHFTEIKGVIIAEINMVKMWGLVDTIKIGEKGYAYVVSKSGLLIAHGSPDQKAEVLKQVNLKKEKIVTEVLSGKSPSYEYVKKGVEVLGVGAPVQELGWGIIIEQPIDEAFAVIKGMTNNLISLILLFMVLMITIGYTGGKRQVVSPIKKLITITRAVSEGDLTARVNILSQDEFYELGESFNEMTGKLFDLQKQIVRKEKEAFFGRIASGLIHDLRHPIRNIENAAGLIKNDPGAFDTFDRIVNREFKNVNRFLDSLYNITKPVTLEVMNLYILKIIDEVVESFSNEAREKNITIVKQVTIEDDMLVQADRFAISRVFNNLFVNAFYAMQDGGCFTIAIGHEKGSGEKQFLIIRFIDTGIGIPEENLSSLFDDFTTSKKMGLGIGLSECKKIVEGHKGTIEAASKGQKGTTFTLRLPLYCFSD